MLTKLLHYSKFDPHFPEDFNWNSIESVVGTEIALSIVQEIRRDLKTTGRIYTPGLRESLVKLADIVKIEIH